MRAVVMDIGRKDILQIRGITIIKALICAQKNISHQTKREDVLTF